MNLFIAPALLVLATCVSTALGGLGAMRLRGRLPLIMGFTAGVILGVVSFELLPEIIEQIRVGDATPRAVMAALAGGFLLFHVVEKLIIIHHSDECLEGGHAHRHPHVGVMSALALSGHSMMDGLGIGLGFKAGPAIGIVVAAAVIAHDFVDGMNTVVVMLGSKNPPKRALWYLGIDALAPAVGLGLSFLLDPSQTALTLYLGFFAGFLLYIGAAHILPEAHSERSSVGTLALTVLGAALALGLSALV